MQSDIEKCPCGGENYIHCCGRFFNDEKPVTALELMRSRYTAFVLKNIDYLWETTHPTLRLSLHKTDIEDWANDVQFISLTIKSTKKGLSQHQKGEVTFKAEYIDKNQQRHTHLEKSFFEKIKNKWYYKKGKY